VNGIVILLVLVVTAIIVWQRCFGHAGRVRDASGHVVPAADVVRVGSALAVLVVGLILLATMVRVVPVGHGLVVLNTVSRGFRLATEGVTQRHDLRRLEYAMTGSSTSTWTNCRTRSR